MATPVSTKLEYDESLFLTLKEKADVFNTTRDKDIFSVFLKYFDTEEIKCKDCGKSVVYYDTTVKVANYAGNIIITLFGKNFFAEKAGSHLCVCEDCLTNKYPDYQEKNKAKTFNRMNKFSQYAYNIPDDVYQRENLRLNSRSEASFILKWGEEEGKRRWEEYRKMCSDTNTFEYKKEKYGWTKEQFDKYNHSRAITLENMVKKYGEEEGTKKFNDYVEKQKETKSWAYMVEKYGAENAAKINSSKGGTYDNYVSKYGKEEGEKRYAEWLDARNNVVGYSVKANEFFFGLDKFLKKNGIIKGKLDTVFQGKSKKEKYIICGKEGYYLDYYIEKLKLNIEYFGDYWHFNPKIYESTYYNDSLGKTAQEKWNIDKHRIDNIEKCHDIRTIVVWESDVDKNPQQVMDNILKVIQDGRK